MSLTAFLAVAGCLGSFANAKPLDRLRDLVPIASGAVLTTEEGATVQVTFLRGNVFRIWASPTGTLQDELVDAEIDQGALFAEQNITARTHIIDKTDYDSVDVDILKENSELKADYVLSTDRVRLAIRADPLTFALYTKTTQGGKTTYNLVWEELKPIDMAPEGTRQYLSSEVKEQFYGGGQQNGQYAFKGKVMEISYGPGWNEFDRPSPAPFYLSNRGYGILRNTWRTGQYDFTKPHSLTTYHNETRFDAYYFVADGLPSLVSLYTELVGRPHLLPRWSYYVGDADCYNDNDNEGKHWHPPGWHDGPTGHTPDVINTIGAKYVEYDMPVGWVLPNDGYECGYTNLSYVVAELGKMGIHMGLWTQRHLDQIAREVGEDGVRVYKLDVAWTGPGFLYSLLANKQAHEGLVTNANTRGMVWTVMGWAGTQRYSVLWTGDQRASWDYIRWHIPTFVGSGHSGQAYSASDIDAIYNGTNETYVRDLQFKSFTPVTMSMSGWSYSERKHPWWFQEPYRSINRDFLKTKSALTPYMYAYAHQADQHGWPIVRGMHWEFPTDEKIQGEEYKYQFMLGESILVAPVFHPISETGGFRDNIYLPAVDTGEWYDYWNGTQHKVVHGSRVVDHYHAPLEIIPVFVRAGAIIPMYEPARSDSLQPKDHLILDLYAFTTSEEGQRFTRFTIYEDDGETYAYKNGAVALTHVFLSSLTKSHRIMHQQVVIGGAQGTYEGMPTTRHYTLVIHGVHMGALSEILANGEIVPRAESASALEEADHAWFYDQSEKSGTLRIKLADLPITQSVTVDISTTADHGKSENEIEIGEENEKTKGGWVLRFMTFIGPIRVAHLMLVLVAGYYVVAFVASRSIRREQEGEEEMGEKARDGGYAWI
eukprot:comp16613_c0_seq1/m.14771 comp16613_c0_seq1/g.14771  ORF comp16613_c0_seq1/g.14771 comp16613_c0_seq1/m.14771 type:complete len:881 (-) comp16613_c0_seq1:449-3091(-)